MSSHEARYAQAIASLTARLDTWGVDDSAEKAHQFIRDMVANGWRSTPVRVEEPPKRWGHGDAKAGAAAAREALRQATRQDAS